MKEFLTRTFTADESGATAIEYAIVAAGIAVTIITAINTLGLNVVGLFGTVTAGFS